ncbi:aldehyde dehydrogenase [Rhizopus microsporus var. microsporus]|uniref:Aldehyde dehydrogenase n=2 Tax=Rhizopus microsporus TaxID=58291 RepID=A0A1X0RAJ4_RHIZD|nr:putative aldehyde dehydrogenase [Rhizopus microsporus ATCC 52813]ORE09080.1 aldehyde dehydrogenase [Rhizopus microsporus var. microsporus]PHZ09552.1 putative aldehyde dehydrogenase [Rhizopus microsporus ATCC 52813]
MSNLVVETTTPKGYKLKLQTGLFINNQFVKGSDTIDTVNPATGKVICAVQAAEAKDVDAAVEAAEAAFQGPWKNMPALQRAALMHKLADLIDRDNEELAQIETLDNGKGITFSRLFDAKQIAISLRYFAGFADKVHGKVIDTEGCLSYTRHEPIGVCGAIIPWNFPLMMLGWKLGPALATGNTIVVKTSEMTPLSALKVAQLVIEAGFPPGVINIITGYGAKAGDALARHMKVAKIAFTGSTLVGRMVMKAAAESNLKKVTLELGGKSPNIIFDDADLDQAVRWAHKGIFFNHGQCCCAGSRVYVQESIYDEFLKRFKEYTSKTKLGDPHDDDTFQGPQISQTQFERIMGYIESGKKEGATCYMGGQRWGNEGYYIEPTVFTDVRQDMKIVQEEIFGPVVTVSKFKDIDDVVHMALDTEYGLAAAVFTQNTARAVDISNRLQAGTVWINCYNELDYNTPFGGFRQSGIGRENGEYALDNYIQVKTVKININRQP